MKPRHQVSRDAMELIKSFEGFRRTAAKLPDGRFTIGYGHTKTAREGVEITEKDADALLIYDLLEINAAVNEWTYAPLTQNQFDALVSFAFNVGLENFRRSSVLRRVNEGAMLQAACAFEMWRKAEFEGERIVVDALVRRRAAEKTLFLTPLHGWVPAPSPVVRPRIDYDVTCAQPKQRPMSLIVPMDGETAVAHEEAETTAPVDRGFDEDQPSATETAAEAVTARLQALIPDAPPQGPEADAGLDLPSPPVSFAPPAPVAAEPLIEAAPVLAEAPAPIEPIPAYAPPTVSLENAVDFTLTPPVSDLDIPSHADTAGLTTRAIETPDHPQLFSPAVNIMSGVAAASPQLTSTAQDTPAPYAPTMANADLARRVVAHKSEPPAFTESFPEAFTAFDEPENKAVTFNLAPYIILGVVGIGLFGGGIAWFFNTQAAASLFVSLIGIIFAALSAYYLFERIDVGSD